MHSGICVDKGADLASNLGKWKHEIGLHHLSAANSHRHIFLRRIVRVCMHDYCDFRDIIFECNKLNCCIKNFFLAFIIIMCVAQ